MNILRPATENDLLLLYEWANDATTRRMSFHSERIDPDTHAMWFRRKLSDNDCYFYILEHDGTPAGTGRLDREPHSGDVLKENGQEDLSSSGFSISYSIAPAFRGKGLGEVLLSLLFEEAEKSVPEAGVLIGEVKKENEASIRCFEKAGFTLEDSRPDSLIFCRRI
ncbi:MAG: GNAT family N-acetyltransferase [Lachnospiraceae bacterium]|nr:GNAT family N-acetyltransferase [Lachnospiraceae bacterium]